MTAQKVLEEVLKLSLDDRKQVAHGLVESILLDDPSLDDNEEIEITPELIAELDRISEEAKAHPERAVTLDEVNAQWDKEVSC